VGVWGRGGAGRILHIKNVKDAEFLGEFEAVYAREANVDVQAALQAGEQLDARLNVVLPPDRERRKRCH